MNYAFFSSFLRENWNKEKKHCLTRCIFLSVVVVFLWILNQIAVQTFNIAVAVGSITPQDEQRKCLEIRKRSNFLFFFLLITFFFLSWPQTRDCLATSHPPWEVTCQGATKSLPLCCFSSVLVHTVSSRNLLRHYTCP